jgi:hypothetical protein
LWVGPAGHVRGHPQGLPQQRVAGFGDAATVLALAGLPGLGDLGDQAGVGADRREAAEPVRVTEPGGDRGRQDWPDSRRGAGDLERVGLPVQSGDPLIRPRI